MQQPSRMIQFCKTTFLLADTGRDVRKMRRYAAPPNAFWGTVGQWMRKWGSDWGMQLLVIMGVGLLIRLILNRVDGRAATDCGYWCLSYGSVLNIGLVALCIRAAQHVSASQTRGFWRLLTAAFSLTAISDAIYLYSALSKDEAVVSTFANPLYILAYLSILLALLYYARILHSSSLRARFGIDMGIIFLGALMVIWYFGLAPIFARPDQAALIRFLPSIYPALDLMLLFGGAIIAYRQPDRQAQRPFLILIIGGLVTLSADLLFASQLMTARPVNDWVFALTDISRLIMAVAAQCQFCTVVPPTGELRQAHPIEKSLYQFLPYMALLVGYGIVLISIVNSQRGSVPWLTIGATVLISLVVIRQILVLRENSQEMSATLRLTEELRRSEARFRSLVQNASDVITVITDQGIILYESPALLPILGYHPDARLERNVMDFIHPQDAARIRKREGGWLEGTSTLELRMLHADNSWLWIEAKLTNLLHDPDIAGIVANYRDISERKRFEEQLRQLAYYDPLTNVANRTLFQEQLTTVFAKACESGNLIAVFLIDLDGFKLVNDQHGHSVGDQLLIMVGQRIRNCLRKGDLVARLGGDEFAILLNHIRTAADAVKVAERIVQSLEVPLQIEDKELVVRGSLGIALHQPGIESADTLLRNADRAMYLAKSDGKGRYALFSSTETHALALPGSA